MSITPYPPQEAALGSAAFEDYDEGEFVVTGTGFSGTAPSGTARYVRVGKQVTVMIPPNISGTSNATTMTLTGLPPALAPGMAVMAPFRCVDNSGSKAAFGLVNIVAGTTTIELYIDGTPAAWTASGTKGWWAIALTYTLL